MIDRFLAGRNAVVFEIGLFAVLASSWTVAYLAGRNAVGTIPVGSRAYLLGIYESDDRLWLALGLGLLGAVCLLARHIHATAAFAAVALIVLVLEARFRFITAAQFASSIMLIVATFWAMLRTERFRLLAWTALAVAALATVPAYEVNRNLASASTASVSARPLVDLGSLVGTLESLVLVGIAIAAAALLRRFDTQAVELAERNRELEQERVASAKAAVLDERVRIARELHDVVAHHVTTMTVHAGAARQIAEVNPTQAVDSLYQIEGAGRNAVTELHRLLGFLRSGDEPDGGAAVGDADRAPVPSLRHLDHLVTNLGDGFTCDVELVGDLDPIPQSVDVSAYRIVQEALTNVMKHSRAESAAVRIDAEPSRIQIEVVDRGPAVRSISGAGSDGRRIGAGHGLVGMHERAGLHGGSVQAGPRPDGGWGVVAVLPYDRQDVGAHTASGKGANG